MKTVDLLRGLTAEQRSRIKAKITEAEKLNQICTTDGADSQAIAIVGLDFRFPGGVNSLEALWEVLIKSSVTTSSKQYPRFAPTHTKSAKNYTAGFIEGVCEFDPEFFGILPKDAELMDPQQRLLLQSFWRTIEDAGYQTHDLTEERTGVYVGACTYDYAELLHGAGIREARSALGTAPSLLANRISFLLNLNGPSETLDTACSSSLVALHHAVQAVRAADAEQALVGGVNLLLSNSLFDSFDEGGMLSPSGYCRPLDASADGYVRAEGVATVLIKPLQAAERDNDHIYALIRSVGVNHGGKANSITSPNPKAQAELLINTYRKASLDFDRINYIEMHGTGTVLGDPLEVEALQIAANTTGMTGSCGIGSVKSNLGHLEAVAGLSGLMKILVCMQHKALVATAQYQQLNLHIDLCDSPFYVVGQPQAWEALKDNQGKALERCAGLSSFGFGGTNAHAVLQEYPAHPKPLENSDRVVVVLSARTEEALLRQAADLSQFLAQRVSENFYPENVNPVCLRSLSYTLQVGREAMYWRLATVVESIPQLLKRLSEFASGNYSDEVTHGQAKIRTQSDMELVDIALADKNIQALSKYWVAGQQVDWQRLYLNEQAPKRMSLPTYPFAKEQYWAITEDASVSITSPDAKRISHGSVLHPLVHRNNSDFSKLRFQSTFSGDESFFTDHRLSGEKILPGVAYLEWAREAGERGLQRAVTQLTDITWLRPLQACANPMETDIVLNDVCHTDSDMSASFEISDGHPSEDTIYCNGRLSTEFLHTVPFVNIASIKQRLFYTVVDRDECYKAFSRMGLIYGPTFQGIEKLYYSETEALSQLSLINDDRFVLPPGTFDSALQTIMGLTFAEKSPQISVPFTAKSILLYADVHDAAWCYVRKDLEASGQGTVDYHDFDILSAGGDVLLSVKGLVRLPVNDLEAQPKQQQAASHEKPVDGKQSSARHFNETFIHDSGTGIVVPTGSTVTVTLNESGHYDGFYYQSCWSELATTSRLATRNKTALVIGQGNIASVLKAELEDREVQVTVVPHINELSVHQIQSQQSVYLLQGLTSLTVETVESQIQLQEQSVFESIKALQTHNKNALELFVCTYKTQTVHAEDIVRHEGAGIIGLAGSLAKEIPHWSIQVIDVDRLDQHGIDYLLSAPSMPDGRICAVRNGLYFQQKLLPLTLNPAGNDKRKLRHGGVYVILGGAGGIGQVTTQYLVEHYQAQVYWLGRRQQDDEITAAIDNIGRQGPKPVYLPCDSTNRAQVEAAYRRITLSGNSVHGLFHSAIVLHDRLIANMEVSDFRQSFDPKHVASHNLLSVFQFEPLDFVCFFSSIQSYICAPGQSNYAAGCVSKDSFSHYVEQSYNIPSYTLNWGYWGEVGAVASTGYSERMRKIGIDSLTAEEGMQALEALLASEHRHITVLKAIFPAFNKSVYASLFDWNYKVVSAKPEHDDESLQRSFAEAAQPVSKVPTDERDVDIQQEKAVDHVLDIFSNSLKLTRDKIDTSVTFHELHIDSISIGVLKHALAKDFPFITTTNFFEYPTVGLLAQYLTSKAPEFFVVPAQSSVNPEESPAQSSSRVVIDSHLAHRVHNQSRIPVPNRFTNRSAKEVTDVAIIGVSGRYPGAKTLHQFWENLVNGENSVVPLAKNQFDLSAFPAQIAEQLSGFYGGLIDDVDKFDPLFFSITPLEAELMDPQERLFLETAWCTIEDAGYTPARLSSVNSESDVTTGVYVGVMYEEYQLLGAAQQQLGNPLWLGGSPSSIANRVSYCCNFTGPSVAVDTMCSSSLTAIHLACQGLSNGDAHVALAGGVNISIHLNKYLNLQSGGYLSSDGLCRSFGADGDGFVPAEGVGAVLLKPLAQAQADQDHIYGVIKGSSITHGGKANGYTVPNPNAQAATVSKAIHRSGVSKDDISYIEAHGTGTSLGDPIEVAALDLAFSDRKSIAQRCAIGSVKSNIGHAESAAGVAGLTKVILQFKHRQLVPSLHSSQLNPEVNFSQTPFKVQQKLEKWTSPEQKPRTAGVSSFGAGGSNAHLIVQEYPQDQTTYESDAPAIIVLSAKTQQQLDEKVEQLVEHLSATDECNIYDIAYTLQLGRVAMDKRLALLVSSVQELSERLTDYLSGVTNGILQQDAFVRPATGSEYIDLALKNNDLQTFAQLWVQGSSIDWQKIYTGVVSPRRISLPTYPFARERYWVPVADEDNESGKSAEIATAYLHPLVHTNQSTWVEQKYQSRFSGDEFFFADHVVNGQKLLPAVAYLEMARAAGEHCLEQNITSFHNVQWLQPLSVKEEPADIFISIYESETGAAIPAKTYDIYRCEDGSEQLISHGYIGAQKLEETYRLDLNAIGARLSKSFTGTQCYDLFQQSGVEYGPGFRGVNRITFGENEALAELQLPQNKKFGLSPGLFDSALQTALALSIISCDALIIPFSADLIEVRGDLHEVTWCFVRVKSASENMARIHDIDLLTAEGEVVIRMCDVVGLPPDTPIPAGVSGVTETPIKVSQSKIELDQTASPVLELALQYNMHEDNELASRGLLHTLVSMGLRDHLHKPKSQLREGLGVIEKYDRLFNECLRELVTRQHLNDNGSYISISESAEQVLLVQPMGEVIEQLHCLKQAFPTLLATCLINFSDVLTGSRISTDVIFPDGNMDLVFNIYKNNKQADYFNAALGGFIQQAIASAIEKLQPGEKITLLEVGAGTGGTSSLLFSMLSDFQDHLRYIYTDVSRSFLMHAQTHYGDLARYMETAIFDLEACPEQQGFELNSCDFVIGTNVVHATRNISHTLGNIKAVLKDKGVLVLNEVGTTELTATLTFGLLDGWWRYEDDALRLPGSPALAAEAWQQVLMSSGFSNAISYPEHQSSVQQIIVAENVISIQPPVYQAQKIASDAAESHVTSEQRLPAANGHTSRHKNSLEYVTRVFSDVLKIPMDRINPKAYYNTIGIDSILIGRLQAALSGNFSFINTATFFEYKTIQELAEHIAQEVPEFFAPATGSAEEGMNDCPSLSMASLRIGE